MNPTTTTPEVLVVNGRQVTVRHTDAAAVLLCERSTSHWARQVANDYYAWLRQDQPRGPFQRRGWLHLLAQEQEYREQHATTTMTSNEAPMTKTGAMPRIIEFLRRPATSPHRKTWGVTFESGNLYLSFETGVLEKFVRIWGRSPKSDGGMYGRPVARIDTDGDLWVTSCCDAAFLAVFDEFEANPVEFVAAAGKRTGRCCFCRLKLTDPRSEEMGYGRICSRRFQLPWGKKRTNRVEENPA